MRSAFLYSLAFAGLAVSGHAALVMNETFSYANGPLTTVSAGLWVRFGGGTNQLDVLSGRAHLTQAETEDDARTFGSFTVGTLYYSFVLNASSLPSGTGNAIAHLKDSATGARGIVFVTTAGAAAGRYRVGVANGASTPSAIVAFDLVPGIDYRIVVCYSQSAAGGPPQTILWINPCSEQDTVRRAMAQDSFNPATLVAIALRQEVAIGVLDIDNLRIGTTFADVAPDTTAPNVMCPSNIVAKCTSPAGTPVNYTVTASDNCDPTVTLACNPPPGSLFPLGNTLVTCTATDDAGNVGRCTFTVTVVDTDPPVMNCPSNIVAKCTNSAGTRVTYTVTATDNCDSNVTVVCVPPSGSLFPLGVTLVTCTATDDSGNQARCTFTVTVRDLDAPIIRCPSNIVVNSTGPNGAQVFYVVTATDDCDPAVALVCTPPSGSIFPNGVTAVNCTATDDSGNQSRCSFTVTVVRPIEIDRFPESRAQVAILFPDGSEELLDLMGPTEVHVFVGPNGEASDNNGNGRDDVDTEMIQLDLAGTSARLGPIMVHLRSPDRHPFERTTGRIEEILNTKDGTLDVPPFASTGQADSFFDIFVEIQAGNQTLHTDRPKRMRTIIRHKPPEPGGTYFNPDILDLLNENDQPTGFRLGRTSHTPNPPPPEIDYFPNSQAQITLQVPGRPDETVMLVGPTTVHVGVGPNGQATDSNNNQLDDVESEIVQLELTGDSSLGPVLVRLRDATKPPFMRSMGMIEETANTQTGRLDLPPFAPAGSANSFFDVFFEVVVANQILHTEIPKRMQAVIRHKPPEPGGTYENPESIELLTENGQPAGVRIGRSSHVPNPQREVDVFNYTLATLLIQLPGGANEAVTVAGSSTAVVNIGPAGQATDTDGDGEDQVESELVALNLAGTSTLVGPIKVRLRPATLHPFMRSLGEIEETANTLAGRLDMPPFAPGGTANSFFDVFFEIEVVAGPAAGVYHADRPKRMQTVIRHKPPAPGDTYEAADLGQIELVDETEKPTGILIGHANHTPNPEKERDYFSYSQGKIVLQYPNGQSERIIVAGPTEVLVCIPPNGQAADTDGDGLDDVPTEIINMNLAGSSSLGPVMVTLDSARCRSLGQIEEKANNTPGTLDLPPFRATGSANSFFDVCFKIEVAGRVFRPCQGPVRLGAMITHKPPAPGEAYMNLFTEVVDLCDENGNPTGIRITQEMHTPNPEKERDYFSYSQGKINLRHPDGHIERVIVAGPTEVLVCVDPTGLAADTDGDGLDQVPTQLTLLNLMGNSSLGPVMVSLNPNQPSNGGIEEKVNATPGVLDLPPFAAAGSANSFFDVFALIKVGNQVLHPASRLHIESMITHKPPAPGEAYMNLVEQTIDLLDANNQPTGFQITGEMHTPNIPKETDYFSYSQGKINLRLPNGQVERVIVAGPTEVQVCINDQDGLAADTDADGLDEVPTQMTQLMLQGNSSLGPITVMLDPNRPSLGQIEEKVNGTPGVLDLDPFGNKGCANSFFDVWVRILVGGQAFCATQALHIEAMICHKPPLPGESYMNLVTQNIQLFNCANGQPTGIFITGEMHTPQIPRETDYFSYSQGKINIRHPNGQIERVIVAGPTEVQVGLNDADGLAADTDGDGLDQVPTEMTQLMLQGNSSLGPVMVMLEPNRPTLGEIEEKVNGTAGVLDVAPFGNQGCANSYFLVYARIKVGNFVLCPAEPLRIESMICHKPPLPGEAYMNLVEQQIPLLDCASGQPTGYVLTGEMHTPNIPKETDYFSYSQGKIVLRYPNGQTERIIVAGPTEVQVCINDQDGLAADTDGDGLDEVPTEMTLLDLRGVSSLGPVVVSLDPAQCRSLGQIEEKVNGTPGVLDLAPFGNQGAANSYFNVCFKMQVGDRVFHTCRPVRLTSMITHKPPAPGEAYMNLIDDIVELCDENGTPTGIRIIQEMHTPVIEKEIDFFPSSYAELDVRGPTGQTETIRLTGPSRVVVCIQPDGLAADTDGDGLDQVPTQMTQLDLSGVSSSLGAIQIRLDPNRLSLGEIEEQVNNTMGTLDVSPFTPTGRADSFFDVFAEFLVGGQVYHTANALRMQTVITHKPPAPGETYVNPFTQPVPILDPNGNPTGFLLVREIHTPNPTNCVSIICPPDIAVWSCSNSAVVNFTVQATNRCGPNVTVVCTPPSGFNFPTGSTMVVCTASDGLGSTATCVFKVTVNADTEPPRIVCPSNIVTWTCSPNGVPVNFNVTATDDCDTNVTITCSQTSGSVFLPGTNVVTCVARDDCGKSSTCAFTVTVIRDVEPPRLVCPSNIVVQTCAEGERVFYNITATDDCDPNVTVICNPPSGSFFPVGKTVVHCVAFDDCGHTNECRFMVTVGLDMQVRRLPGGLLEICWSTNCPDFKLQCTHDFSKPIQWLPVTNAPVVSNGMFCVRLDTRGPASGGPTPRFYRLIRYTPREAFSPTDTLPPPGSYKTMPGDVVPFFNGVQTRWFVDRIPPLPVPTNPPCLTCPPLIMSFPTVMDFQYSTDEGRHFDNAMAPANATVRVSPAGMMGTMQIFDTEMLSLNISGGNLPAGVMIRESPTMASLGRHTIQPTDGGFFVSSFFDVWVEVTLDGGQTWSRSLCPAHVDYMSLAPSNSAATDRLPPQGSYDSPQGVRARYANGLILRRIMHRIVPGGTDPKPPPCLTCPPDTQELQAMVSFEYSMDGGQNFMPVSASGRTMVTVDHSEDTADTSFFDTEMLSMNIVGGGLPAGVMIRESPTMRSKGQTTIQMLAEPRPDPFVIRSFFDVFTEISLDGGQTWAPSMEATHVELQPGPIMR